MATRKPAQADAVEAAATAAADSIQTVKHRARRKNIPPAGIEAQGRVEESPKVRHHYNPHLPPVLRFSRDPAAADRLPELLQTARQRALSDEEAQLLAEAVQFYRHEVDWSNRMILGDSLAVMASLSRREDLVAKVQMVDIDPPYGISFKSNFQPQLGQRGVKDQAQDLTREPEMVKAYRDTWTLGVHSYRAYLRDRLAMARELLTDSGSVFVQISDEHLHRVRCVMDDVFGAENFVSVVSFKTTTTGSGDLLAAVNDCLIWYAKDKQRIKSNALYLPKPDEPDNIYKYLEFANGHELTLGASHSESRDKMLEASRLFSMDNITSSRPAGDGELESFEFQGFDHPVTKGTYKSDGPGLKRLARANRLGVTGTTLRYKRMFLDFAVKPIANMRTDTSTGSFTESKV